MEGKLTYRVYARNTGKKMETVIQKHVAAFNEIERISALPAPKTQKEAAYRFTKVMHHLNVMD